MTGKAAKAVAKTVANKPLKVAKKPSKDAKATKATKAVPKTVAKKPPKDAKATKATKATKAVPKTVAKKPPKDTKVAKAAKAVPKNQPKDTKVAKAAPKKQQKDTKIAKTAKAVAKKHKKQISYGGMLNLRCLFCSSSDNTHQPVAQQPLTQLDERINIMNIIKQYFEKYNYGNECVYEGDNGLYIKNLQLIIKDLGEYVDEKKNILTAIIDGIVVVIKLIEKRDELEKNIMVAIRDHIISKKISKHFIIIYFYSLCSNNTIHHPLITYNESVENNLNHILYYLNHDDETFYNLLIQSLLSIGTFHNLTGYVHMDTHMGNFLYAKNSEHNSEGYYMYRFGNETYYLKSCGYNVMIYDFGDSNKIKIPTDKIKRFELFYEEKYIVARSYIVEGGLYNIMKGDGSYILYKPNGEIDIIVGKDKVYKTINGNIFKYDDISNIFDMFVNIENKVNYYRMKILINEYSIFLKMVSSIFVRGNRTLLINTINDMIEALKNNYLGLPLNITDEVFYGYAKDIFKSVLDICITKFPNLLTREVKQRTAVLNAPPFLLYQEEKIVVEEVSEDAL